MVSIFLMVGCGKPQDSLVAAIDKHGDEAMASTTKAEAREWMQAANTNLIRWIEISPFDGMKFKTRRRVRVRVQIRREPAAVFQQLDSGQGWA